jgi:hypothetical protein
MVEINGMQYYETTGSFEDLRSLYSEVFVGGALDWILSTKFVVNSILIDDRWRFWLEDREP